MNGNTIVDGSGALESSAVQTMVAPDAPECAAREMAVLQPVVTTREEHSISRRDIDPDALKVLYRLARNNYIAYLVGGGVRDLLLGRKPKDFDVSTNAKPEQIRTLFRNCILIGRRFRLAHIRYGDKIIETSTFRSTPKLPADPTDPDADLFQRDDNMFGSPQEDALRRDFTVNGLFYDIESFSIIDYVGGMEDLAARRIRCIGDPNIRFREDPVRMVRAIRFASRLGFTLDPETEEAIRRHGEELTKASPARLLEEITRLFAFASGERAVRLLHSTGLLKVILPEVAALLDSDKIDHNIFWNRLQALDTGDTVLPEATPALIFAVLFLDALKINLQKDWSFETAPRLRFDKVHAFLDPLSVRLRFPRKLVDRIVHMYINQNRFTAQGNKGKKGTLTNFVTQDAFHESLALAEIVLTSENGSQTRLNHWRDLLAERIFGREEGPPERYAERERDRDRNRHGNQRGATAAAAAAAVAAQPQAAAQAGTAEVQAREEDLPGRKLSRSARRRRNKRMRRMQGQDAETAAAGSPTETEAAATTVPAPAPAPAEEPAAKSRGRGERSRKKETAGEKTGAAQAEETAAVAGEAQREEGKAAAPKRGGKKPQAGKAEKSAPAKKGGQGKPPAKNSPAAEPEAGVAAEPMKPLTAAAFWSAPEPEPEPEPEKKKRGGRKKAASSKSKAKEKAEEKNDDPMDKKPLPMDKADEADIPMHWLDEI